MSKKLFVGNLDFKTTEDDLDKMFSDFGEIEEAIIIKEGNRSKGFGFVTFSEEDSAQDAVKGLNEKEVNGRKITVNVAKEREERSSSDRPRFERRAEPEDEYSKYYSTTLMN